MNYRHLIFVALAAPAIAPASAETAADFLGRYQTEARSADPGFSASARRGEEFFRRVGGKDWSCSTCHTDNPAAPGKHATTGKAIDALAPSANERRFTRNDKVEKWFRRNCNDVVGRACSAAEKSDLLAYLMTVKK